MSWQEEGATRMSDAQRRLLNAVCGDLAQQIKWHGFRLSKDDWRHMIAGTMLGWRMMPGIDMGEGPKFIMLGGKPRPAAAGIRGLLLRRWWRWTGTAPVGCARGLVGVGVRSCQCMGRFPRFSHADCRRDWRLPAGLLLRGCGSLLHRKHVGLLHRFHYRNPACRSSWIRRYIRSGYADGAHMSGKLMSKAESARVVAAKEGRCMACEAWSARGHISGYFVWDAGNDYHHLKSGNMRRGHRFGIGLCGWHHRGLLIHGWDAKYTRQVYGPSLMDGSRLFHEAYGTDEELLARQDRAIGWVDA
jgi:hypothetical protein